LEHYFLFTSVYHSKTRYLALLSIFAVLYTVLRIVPTFPLVGFAGTFSASDIIAPLYGLILGPIIGAGSIILGTFLAFAFGRPMIFLGLDFVPAMVSSVAVGLLVQKRIGYTALVHGFLILLFLIHPLTILTVEIPSGIQIPFNWIHFISFLVLISPLSQKAIGLVISKSKYLTLGLFIICFIGTMMQHLTGAILFASILGLFTGTISIEAWPGIWNTAFYLYPLERIAIAILAAITGSALIAALGYYFKSGNLRLNKE